MRVNGEEIFPKLKMLLFQLLKQSPFHFFWWTLYSLRKMNVPCISQGKWIYPECISQGKWIYPVFFQRKWMYPVFLKENESTLHVFFKENEWTLYFFKENECTLYFLSKMNETEGCLWDFPFPCLEETLQRFLLLSIFFKENNLSFLEGTNFFNFYFWCFIDFWWTLAQFTWFLDSIFWNKELKLTKSRPCQGGNKRLALLLIPQRKSSYPCNFLL